MERWPKSWKGKGKKKKTYRPARPAFGQAKKALRKLIHRIMPSCWWAHPRAFPLSPPPSMVCSCILLPPLHVHADPMRLLVVYILQCISFFPTPFRLERINIKPIWRFGSERKSRSLLLSARNIG